MRRTPGGYSEHAKGVSTIAFVVGRNFAGSALDAISKQLNLPYAEVELSLMHLTELECGGLLHGPPSFTLSVYGEALLRACSD